jgi:ubiquinone biosynthesis protein
MLYFLVRVTVNALALFLTILLAPGLWLNPAIPYDALNLVIVFVLMGALFWFLNWLLWPIVLFLGGRLLVSLFGGVVIFISSLILYLPLLRSWGPTVTGELVPYVLAAQPVWLWLSIASLLMTAILFVLEGVTGLDSPIQCTATSRRRYWHNLSRLALGQRAPFVENLRVAQSFHIISRYGRDIAFDATPLAPVRRFFQRHIYRRRRPLIDEDAPTTVRLMLEELGPTFVKLGQLIASRGEQLPPGWRDELALLQNEVEPFAYADVQAILTQELGQSPEKLFACFDEQPLAAASTAQVHRATLVNGQPVVVKVQRPDIDVTVRADLNVMRDLTALLNRHFAWAKRIDLHGIMTEYAENILLELDYNNQLLNSRLLAQNMSLFPEVHLPTVYPHLSTKRVLTQEFVSGVKITNIAALDAAGLDRPALAVTFLRALIKQILFDGFFHADPHPGNVLVDTATGQIIFLDMGMMGTLTAAKRMALADLIWSLAEQDNREVGRVLLRLTTNAAPENQEGFLDEVDLLLRRYTSFSDMGVSFGGAMTALLNAMYRAGLHIDAEMTMAIKAMMQAEEIIATLDPQLLLIDVAFAESKELLVKSFDPDALGTALRRQLVRAAKGAVRNLPSLEDGIGAWLKELSRGRLTLYLDASEASRQIQELDATLTVNMRRLTLALLLVGLLIGASIASTVHSSIVPNLAETAYLIFLAAVVLAGGVILRTFWHWLQRGEL